MTLSRIIDKQLLIDTGDENEVYNKTHLIELENSKLIEFTTRELIEFADAEKKLGKNIIQSILKLVPTIEKKEPISSVFIYKNSEGLPVYIKIYDEYYILIALGEFQYGRYKMYLEGVFQRHLPNISASLFE